MDIKLRNSIKTLTRSFYDYQNERLALDGRLGILKDGTDKKGAPPKNAAALTILLDRRAQVFSMETELAKTLAKEVHKTDLWNNFLKHVKGCGETMAAVIISEFDINIGVTVSNLWSFAGLAPGKDRKVKGKKCTFNQFLRAKLCGVLGSSFIKCASPYSKFYYDHKHRLQSKDWGMLSKNPTDKSNPKAGHQHKASVRKMVKEFLKDLYVAWRTMENLPVRAPYKEEYLGKIHQNPSVSDPIKDLLNKLPNKIKPVSAIKKTITSERADTNEKSTIHERAMLEETPKKTERVRVDKKTTIVERAIEGEKPKKTKRAIFVKKTTYYERAKNKKNPNIKKRAIHDEKSNKIKRASVKEKPKTHERVIRVKKTNVDERANIIAKPKKSERAISVKKTRTRKRAIS